MTAASDIGGLISIVTPTLRADHVELWRCLTSVQRQTCGDFEQIVASDGTREHGTQQMVESLRDPRVRYVVTERHHGHKGSGARHEVMMAHARGRFLVFLDDDNIIFPTYLEKMRRALAAALAATEGATRSAFCEILHFGPVHPKLGRAPVVLAGVPEVYRIDTLQCMVEVDAMRAVGWESDSAVADGLKYEALAQRHGYVVVPEVLCAHL